MELTNYKTYKTVKIFCMDYTLFLYFYYVYC